MPRIHLTDRGIKKLTAGKWLTDYMDEGLPGFGARAHHTGLKVFFVRYTAEDGKRRRIKIGPYPTIGLADAREKAKDIIGRIARGEDPQAKKEADRDSITFAHLASEYLEIHAKRKKRSWKEDERIINADLLPNWKRRKAAKIKRRDVADLLDGIVDRGSPIM